MIDPLTLTPPEGIDFCEERSLETGRLEYERQQKVPWRTSRLHDVGICRGHGWPVFVERSEFDAWIKPASRTSGGRPPKYDWEAIEGAFRERVACDGLPERTNVNGWQTQADVARWIQAMAAKGGNEEPAWSTATDKAKEFLNRIMDTIR